MDNRIMNVKVADIPQAEYGSLEYATWGDFLLKVSKGSFKAPQMLMQAEDALVRLGSHYLRNDPIFRAYKDCMVEALHQFGSAGCPSETCNAPFEACLLTLLLPEPMFQTAQDFYKQVYGLENAFSPIMSQQSTFNARDVYDQLWKRSATVDEEQLLHDSIVYCLQNWTVPGYAGLRRKIKQSKFDYNSQDVTSAMIMVVSAWSASALS